MPGKITVHELGFVRLDSQSKSPLFRQLYDAIRTAILDGRLTPSSRLPSSRDLMDQLQVSRTTVVAAIDLLIAEGYLQSFVGSGTFVSGELPDERPFVNAAPIKSSGTAETENSKPSLTRFLSKLGKSLSKLPQLTGHIGVPKPFCPGIPALDEFPIDVWSKIVRRVWSNLSIDAFSYGDSAGYGPLRQSIAEYLRVHRGVRCETNQAMIVSGTQQAIDIVARISLNPGEQVLFENPGYVSARESLVSHGAQVKPLPIDEKGAMIGQAIERYPSARLIYVTPSHQYPLGGTLSIDRRLELVKWAGKTKGLIIEDDYDSEYRYSQEPIPSMQGLDSSNRTIYVGSFSKVVFPGLGMGYAIIPLAMVDAFANALKLTGRPVSQVDQIILNEFIREGHFSRHIRRMRQVHSMRQQAFFAEVQTHLSDHMTIVGSQAGLHCATILKTDRSDVAVSATLKKGGIIARPLSDYYMKGTRKSNRLNGLVFGFACTSPAEIKAQVKKISELI